LATWIEMSRDSLQAAKALLKEGRLRSSISRSYYAAYCAVTRDLVERGVGFAHGWQNPAHEQLPGLVLHNTDWTRNLRDEINKAIRRLRDAREDADYRPGAWIDRRVAVNALRDADFVAQRLGVYDE
jgi:uncharacterized protein (UPF0332 family)